MSEVTVEMDRAFAPDKQALQQLWAKLRNQVQDAERRLPPGAGPVIVNDDFGDVYSLFFGITGAGYSLTEITDYAEDLRKELLLVPGVAKVALLGQPEEAIFIEVATTRASQLAISPDAIYQTLQQQSVAGAAGRVRVGPSDIEIAPGGQIDSLAAISDLFIAAPDGTSQVRLGDIASVKRGYKEPPACILKVNGVPAVGLGIANVTGGNVVEMGDAVKARLAELEEMRPIGMDLNVISYQSDSVREAVDGFMSNLVAAVLIVIVTLWIFMGFRSSLIMAVVLILTVMATLILMYMDDIAMQRISLGALIIALGMLVDNAIVVTEGILVRTQRGEAAADSARSIVKATTMPLLGGTVVGALAFSAIGLSPDNTGEYAGSLFWVITYSLILSWILAITLTPVLCVWFLKSGAASEAAGESRLFGAYRLLLRKVIRRRRTTVAVLLILLVASIAGFGFVPSGFFPDSTRPQFVVDYWLPQGTHIDETAADLDRLRQWVSELDGVTRVTSVAGQGALRFMLTYGPEAPNSSYGQLLVDVTDYRLIAGLVDDIQAELNENYPQAQGKAWKFVLGPGGGSKIEVAFRGPDPKVLRKLADDAKAVLYKDGGALAIKDDWREQTIVLRPVFSEPQARRAGVSLGELRQALQTAFSGSQVGIYREKDKLLPVIARLPESERLTADQIAQAQVYSPATGAYVPVTQVVRTFETAPENAIIRRENRFPTIQAQADPVPGEMASDLLGRIRPEIEAIPLPPGYSLKWNGEYGDSTEAQAGLMGTLPFCFLSMVIVVILLFNAVRQPLIIWMTVPLSIIGVTVGLLLFNAAFEFMAILGFLSLTGMLIKNAIVLVDQIDLEIREGKEPFAAIIDSACSRVRPVCMGAATTVLGVAPLLMDPFFKSMAITIMFGLTFATVLTLLFVPVLYAIAFSIHDPARG
ncbi:MAG: efflux RND transporter permease subunit, partial [Candidatus Hydrogenedentes bacterium]|nr:efflux RND transporter permease subunit [Candidatus Hydrogenedentota bacterium]